MSGLQLIATGGAIPGRTVTNEDLSRMVDTSDEWITSRTGIRTRHWCTEDESAATLAISAAKQALARSGLAPAQIGCCICATLSAPDATPSVACQVQAALGLPEDRPALDVNAACSGFLYGIAVAQGLLTTLGGQYALVIGCEALSRLMDPTDRSTCVLFGDGAGAAVITLDENSRYAFDCGADGNTEVLYCPKFYHNTNPFAASLPEQPEQQVKMEGRAVYSFAVQALSGSIRRVADQVGGYPEHYICHQANARILQAAAKQLKEPMEKFFLDIAKYGNTSAASIAIALDDCVRSGAVKRGESVMLSGFGGGLSYGTAYFTF